MVDLARLIRSFGAVDVAYPRRIVKVDETPPDNVVLAIGSEGGAAKTLGYSRSYSLTTYMKQKRKEKKKKKHVVRIIGKSRGPGGTVVDVPEAWIDVERDESVTTEQGGGLNYQEIETRYNWYVDENGKQINPNRETRIVKVFPSDADPDDPYLWFEIDVNDTILVDDAGQEIHLKYNNTKNNVARRDPKLGQVRRVVHFDTPYDNDPKYANGGIIRDYEKTPDTQDRQQNLDIEIVEAYQFEHYIADAHVRPVFEHWQETEVKRIPDELEAQIADTIETDKTYGDEKINPPFRLDPNQRIVNLNIGEPDLQWLMAVKPDTATGTGFNIWPPPFRADAHEGKTWDGMSSGATGLGFTVVTAGCIAFGFVTADDGARRKCFLRSAAPVKDAPPCPVYMGTFKDGSLIWTKVFTAPSSVSSLSFANDAFFISHLVPLGGGNFSAAMTVTRDGKTFTRVNPFAGLDATAPGDVAYNKKTAVYACIAMVFIDEGDTFSSSMAWATSSDGLTWVADYQRNVYGQPGQNGSPTRTTVCFGNGVFVAAASYKNRFPDRFHVPPGPDYVLASCAVATSTNGSRWNIVKLPDTVVRSSGEVGDRAGDTFAVAFIRDKKDDPEGIRDGYFVACGQESGGNELTNTAKLWRSPDGLKWTLIKEQDSSVFHPIHYDALSAIAKKLPTDTAKIIVI